MISYFVVLIELTESNQYLPSGIVDYDINQAGPVKKKFIHKENKMFKFLNVTRGYSKYFLTSLLLACEIYFQLISSFSPFEFCGVI